MKRYMYLLLLAILPAASFAQDTLLNLDQCIAIAIKNNVEANRSGIRSEAAKISYQQQRANLLPDLNANLNHGINQGRSIDPSTNGYINQQITYASQGIGTSLLLFNGQGLQKLIKQYSLAYQAAVQEEQQVKESLSMDVTLAYLQVLTNSDLLVLARAQQTTTLQQSGRLEALNQNGNIAPGEYYDLKGQYANDKLSVINAENSLENSKIALAELMNVPYSASLKLVPVTAADFSLMYAASSREVYETAIQKLAAIKAVDLRQKSAEMQVKATRSGFYPSIFFNGGLSSNFSSSARDFSNRRIGYFDQFSNNLNRSFSVGVSIPLFNSFRTKNAVSLARLNYRETVLIAQSSRTQIQQFTERAYLNMVSSRGRYLALQEQVAAYTESFRTAEIRFNAGVINSVDYLVAKNNLERTQLNLVATGYDFILRKKILDFYQGRALGM